ncbi:MAG: Uma2 family endonuclease [Pleurocapsa sp. SU_5_0]|nr:Uma2 family endonuclease [Pleurocapsa sp. SU_5_0]NJO96487.1 Uma2 family endonuclease [Pleurocapsa sp. CRU_1_2]NJR44397.1 Uma2 family endonuclease [Hyellaceae cyanobacterium CSU_1_1]
MKTLYKWSVEDYHRIIESGVLEGKSVELLEGKIIAMSPEKPLHSSRIDTVADYLRDLLRGVAKVREAHPITLDNSEPEPDLAIVRFDDNNYSDRHPYPQDIYWLVEVSNSTLSKDLAEKSVIYARNGIPEYWVIDLLHNKLWLFTNPQQNSYLNKQSITTGKINSGSFPNVSIEIDKLLSNRI